MNDAKNELLAELKLRYDKEKKRADELENVRAKWEQTALKFDIEREELSQLIKQTADELERIYEKSVGAETQIALSNLLMKLRDAE